MKTFGIIAEYNPFHNGHRYQINYAKEALGADNVVVVMSGDFVQRGEPALIDKYKRSNIAISEGADLIIELPTIAATSSAEIFAESGINLLLSTNIITDIVFGCEDESPELFLKIAKLLNEEPPLFKETLDKELRSGKSYAAAKTSALLSVWEEKEQLPIVSHFFNSPNNLLGIEYTRAILKRNPSVNIHPLTRVGSSHDDLKFNGSYASASFIRNTLLSPGATENDVFSFVPHEELHILKQSIEENTLISPNDVSFILHHKLLEQNDLSEILDCSNELSNRIKNELSSFLSFTQFCDILKTKNLTHSRIRRVLTHIYLNIKKSQLLTFKDVNYAPYLHVLGFSEKGSSLLKEIKKNSNNPLFTSPKDINKTLNKNQIEILTSDLFAADVYRSIMTNKSGTTFPTEFTRKFMN
ncbi:MAG: nucleotidyltransferase [Lachnospiraceae bacterium]|nr:nucleotidyltransferase [Lachnospiraceae bacterium]